MTWTGSISGGCASRGDLSDKKGLVFGVTWAYNVAAGGGHGTRPDGRCASGRGNLTEERG